MSHPDPACAYVTLPDGGQVHYRIAGEGPPLVMLHASPQDSSALLPAMGFLSEICTCIALDTPGYGLSDDIVPDDPCMADYAEVVFAFADALGLERFYLYGAATGAQVAIEMGKRQPERLALVVLDSNGHIPEAERGRIILGYFPSVTPRRDGGHLLTYWDMCTSLFYAFPWHSSGPADRLGLPTFPPEAVQAILLRYLLAGESYPKAYRAALHCEDIAHLEGMTAPAVMTRWEGSVVLAITDAMIAQGLPENVRVLRASAGLEQRHGVQVDALREAMAREDAPAPFAPADLGPGLRRYYDTPQGQLHTIALTDGEGPLAVVLHGAGGSAQACLEDLADIIGTRPALLVDLPGHGHTRIAAPEEMTPDALAAAIVPLLDATGASAIELVGEGLGGVVALALQAMRPELPVTLIKPLQLTPDMQDAFRARGIPDFSPRASGAHLVEAWHYVRQDAMRWPWFDGAAEALRDAPQDLSPARSHARLADILRCGAAFGPALLQEITADWARLQADAQGPVRTI